MENEIWKDIYAYPGYQISNLGRIKSLPRNVRRKNYSGRITTYRVNEKILTATIGNMGYHVINL